MHLREADFKAYQDGEAGAEEQARIQAHLGRCRACQQRAAALLEQSTRIAASLERLEPGPLQNPIPTPLARARLAARLEINAKEQFNMWQKLTTRIPRQAWVALAVVAILAISLAFAPVRAIASSFLGLFRVEQVRVIEIDPDEISHQLESSSEVANLMGENVQIEAQGEPQEVSDAAEAGALAGFAVRLPAEIEGEPQLMVQPGGSATFNVDLELVDAVLHDIGRSDIQLPRELDGASVEITVPTVVVAEYGHCRPDENADPDISATPRPRLLDDCTTLTQMPSPTISAPPELDIVQLGEAYLQLLGMEPDEAAQFASTVDWTSTFVVPIPRYDTEYLEVAVGDATGTLVYRAQGYAPFYILLWIDDGIVYALKGSGDWTPAVDIANSLE
jgi:anti-sigma factor RsiW